MRTQFRRSVALLLVLSLLGNSSATATSVSSHATFQTLYASGRFEGEALAPVAQFMNRLPELTELAIRHLINDQRQLAYAGGGLEISPNYFYMKADEGSSPQKNTAMGNGHNVSMPSSNHLNILLESILREILIRIQAF